MGAPVKELLLPALMVAACQRGRTTAGLGVDLCLDQDTVAIHDLLQ